MNETFCNYPGKRDETIVAYLYGEMEADERVAFDRHLVACAPCRAELADLHDVRSQLARSVPPELPAHLPFTADMLIVLDTNETFLLSGTGDLIQPDDGIVAIGSGGPYALAAARALAAHSDLDARSIAEKSMAIASEICLYTNANIALEEL